MTCNERTSKKAGWLSTDVSPVAGPASPSRDAAHKSISQTVAASHCPPSGARPLWVRLASPLKPPSHIPRLRPLCTPSKPLRPGNLRSPPTFRPSVCRSFFLDRCPTSTRRPRPYPDHLLKRLDRENMAANEADVLCQCEVAFNHRGSKDRRAGSEHRTFAASTC